MKTWRTLLILVCAVQVAQAQVRTWTSTAGATLQAQLVRQESDGRVILRTGDGRLMGIPLAQLSPADQAFVRANAPSASPGGIPVVSTTQAAPPAVDIPEPPVAQPRTRAFESNRPNERAVTDLPAVALRAPQHATYYALQYGPRSQDVAYFIFDRPAALKPADRLYVYAPETDAYKEPVALEAGERKMGNQRPNLFTGITFESQTGPFRATFQVEFLYGLHQPTLAYVEINVTLSGPSGTSVFLLLANITGDLVSEGKLLPQGSVLPEGTLLPQPLITEPRLVIGSVRGLRVELDLYMGPFHMVPISGGERDINIEAAEEGADRPRDRDRIRLAPDPVYGAKAYGPSYQASLPKLKDGTMYRVSGAIAPTLMHGNVTGSTLFTPGEDH